MRWLLESGGRPPVSRSGLLIVVVDEEEEAEAEQDDAGRWSAGDKCAEGGSCDDRD